MSDPLADDDQLGGPAVDPAVLRGCWRRPVLRDVPAANFWAASMVLLAPFQRK